MTIQAQISTHADSKEDEAKIIGIVKRAHDEIQSLGHGAMSWFNATTHHGTGDVNAVYDASQAQAAAPAPEAAAPAEAAPEAAAPAAEETPPAQ